MNGNTKIVLHANRPKFHTGTAAKPFLPLLTPPSISPLIITAMVIATTAAAMGRRFMPRSSLHRGLERSGTNDFWLGLPSNPFQQGPHLNVWQSPSTPRIWGVWPSPCLFRSALLSVLLVLLSNVGNA